MEKSLLIAFLPLTILILIAWTITRGIKKVANKYPPAAPEQSTVSGVGGWLLLLIFSFMFLGPLTGAARINFGFMSLQAQYPTLKTLPEWGTFKSTVWCTFLFMCYLSFYAGFGLVKGRNMLVVMRAKIILWVIGPLAILMEWVFFPVSIFKSDLKFVEGMIEDMIASVIAVTIWTFYLSKSKRVRATYGNNAPSTNLLQLTALRIAAEPERLAGGDMKQGKWICWIGVIAAAAALVIILLHREFFLDRSHPNQSDVLLYLGFVVFPCFIIILLAASAQFWWAMSMGLWVLYCSINICLQENASPISVALFLCAVTICATPFLNLYYQSKKQPTVVSSQQPPECEK